MSRVHEAISRAQGGSNEGPAATGQAGVPMFPLEGQEAAAWASEGSTSRSPADAVGLEVESPTLPPVDNPVLDEPVATVAEKLVLSPDTDHLSIEQYRRLAGRLHLAQAEHGIKVVMIASALPGEGKTLTATNLALTLSESYQRQVLLIDADLRKPALHNVFKLNTTSGLSEGLQPDVASSLIVRQITPRLSLLPGGRPNHDPMAGLTSDRMRRLIEEAKETFDWIIIDTPPLVLLPDANL